MMIARTDADKIRNILGKAKASPSGCIELFNSLSEKGYPIIYHNNKKWRASRFVWTFHFGDIPEKMIVMHKCDNPKCINIEHLQIGTHMDNCQDKIRKGRSNPRKKKAFCPRGHPYSGSNLRIVIKNNKEVQHCIECIKILNRQYYDERLLKEGRTRTYKDQRKK